MDTRRSAHPVLSGLVFQSTNDRPSVEAIEPGVAELPSNNSPVEDKWVAIEAFVHAVCRASQEHTLEDLAQMSAAITEEDLEHMLERIYNSAIRSHPF